MIRGTDLEKQHLQFCQACGVIKTPGGPIVGERCYQNFMLRHEDVLRRSMVKIQDLKRATWCTVENFTMMYDNIYPAMVDCGVAELLDNEIMYDRDGNETPDLSKLWGRPTKYRMLRPDRCVFVDETGCKTNQTDDGNYGGELFVVPKGIRCGRTGVTTDLHFTVVPFISGTGDAIMVAVILKSEKHIRDCLASWQWGIDMRKKPSDGKTRVELYETNCEILKSVKAATCECTGIRNYGHEQKNLLNRFSFKGYFDME
jgi:hypothetical protein